jgi:hypothetical protein
MGRTSRKIKGSRLSAEVLHIFLGSQRNSRALIELYYWSQEEHLVDLMRAFVLLPDDTKAALTAFLKLSNEKSELVTASIPRNGSLMLESPRTCHEFARSSVLSPSKKQSPVKH